MLRDGDDANECRQASYSRTSSSFAAVRRSAQACASVDACRCARLLAVRAGARKHVRRASRTAASASRASPRPATGGSSSRRSCCRAGAAPRPQIDVRPLQRGDLVRAAHRSATATQSPCAVPARICRRAQRPPEPRVFGGVEIALAAALLEFLDPVAGIRRRPADTAPSSCSRPAASRARRGRDSPDRRGAQPIVQLDGVLVAHVGDRHGAEPRRDVRVDARGGTAAAWTAFLRGVT